MIHFSGNTMKPIEPPTKYLPTRTEHFECTASRRWLMHMAIALPALLLASAGSAQADYGFDPGFNPNYFIDAFATDDSGGAYHLGRRLVVLPNGDIVVAGEIRFPNDPLGNNFGNVGLVRYSPAGVRQPWSGMGNPHAWFDNQYIVYPNIANGGSGDQRIFDVRDIAYAGSKIYVLVNRLYEFDPFDLDAKVLVFNEDGFLRDEITVLGSPAQEYSSAFDVRETGLPEKPIAVTVVASRDNRDVTIAKFGEDGNSGFLVPDLTFNGGAPLQIILPPCSSEPVCPAFPVDIDRPNSLFSFDLEPIYIAGTAFLDNGDTDMIVLRVSSDGSLDTSFGINGRRLIAFDEPNSNLQDYAIGLKATPSDVQSGVDEAIWVAGTVNRSCKAGVGIAKLTTSGNFDASFAFSGQAVYGGSTETGSVCAQDSELEAEAMTVQSGEIAVAGTTTAEDQGGLLRTDGFLLRVGAQSSVLRELTALPLIQNGIRVGDSRLSGIANAGNGRYLVAGSAFWPGTYESLYVSARLWPTDRIFADDFEPSTNQPF
jgi:hypothetical protein